MRAQRRAQYEQKLMRIGYRFKIISFNNVIFWSKFILITVINFSAARANNSVAMSIMKAAYDNQRHPAMALYPTTIPTQNPVVINPRQLRGRSPFKQNLQSLKAVTKSVISIYLLYYYKKIV
jgi:hypothetical protein